MVLLGRFQEVWAYDLVGKQLGNTSLNAWMTAEARKVCQQPKAVQLWNIPSSLTAGLKQISYCGIQVEDILLNCIPTASAARILRISNNHATNKVMKNVGNK